MSEKSFRIAPDRTFQRSMLSLVALDGFLKGGIDHILNLQSFTAGNEPYLVQKVGGDDGAETLFLRVL